jgi:hypothetical protein
VNASQTCAVQSIIKDAIFFGLSDEDQILIAGKNQQGFCANQH